MKDNQYYKIINLAAGLLVVCALAFGAFALWFLFQLLDYLKIITGV